MFVGPMDKRLNLPANVQHSALKTTGCSVSRRAQTSVDLWAVHGRFLSRDIGVLFVRGLFYVEIDYIGLMSKQKFSFSCLYCNWKKVLPHF